MPPKWVPTSPGCESKTIPYRTGHILTRQPHILTASGGRTLSARPRITQCRQSNRRTAQPTANSCSERPCPRVVVRVPEHSTANPGGSRQFLATPESAAHDEKAKFNLRVQAPLQQSSGQTAQPTTFFVNATDPPERQDRGVRPSACNREARLPSQLHTAAVSDQPTCRRARARTKHS